MTFRNQLNINKPYFRGFINKYEGIAEAEELEEQSNAHSIAQDSVTEKDLGKIGTDDESHSQENSETQ